MEVPFFFTFVRTWCSGRSVKGTPIAVCKKVSLTKLLSTDVPVPFRKVYVGGETRSMRSSRNYSRVHQYGDPIHPCIFRDYLESKRLFELST